MGVVKPTPGGGSRAISTKLDPAQLALFELAVAALGLSRAAFIRAAVLRQIVALHPYEPLMAQGLATLAACRAAVKSGKVADDALRRERPLCPAGTRPCGADGGRVLWGPCRYGRSGRGL